MAAVALVVALVAFAAAVACWLYVLDRLPGVHRVELEEFERDLAAGDES